MEFLVTALLLTNPIGAVIYLLWWDRGEKEMEDDYHG